MYMTFSFNPLSVVVVVVVSGGGSAGVHAQALTDH